MLRNERLSWREWHNMKVQHKYIKFVGDYGKLKSMGFEFCRLFASNYMQWCNNETRVWKKGEEVTLDRLTNFEGAFFELYTSIVCWDNRFLRTENLPQHFKALPVVKNRANNTVSFDYPSYRHQLVKLMDDPDARYDLECTFMNTKDLEPLNKLIELGWVELGEREIV